MLEAIKNRRSVRFYRDEPVSDADLNEVLAAGFCAPSAHNQRAWHVVVVRDQAIKDKLAAIHPWSKMLSHVPVVLVVAVDKESCSLDHFWIEDGSAFMENMLVQAAELNLGTCWVGIRGLKSESDDAEQRVRSACGLPEHFGILGLTPIGRSARYPGPHEPKLPEDRVHYL